MKKEEIVESMRKELTALYSEDPEYLAMAIECVESNLSREDSNANIRTCADFSDLNIECCQTCHHFYQHYEMQLVDIESGGNAWICCAMSRALNPIRHAQREQSPEGQETERVLREIFGVSDNDERID